jgi:hypothetical protein
MVGFAVRETRQDLDALHLLAAELSHDHAIGIQSLRQMLRHGVEEIAADRDGDVVCQLENPSFLLVAMKLAGSHIPASHDAGTRRPMN